MAIFIKITLNFKAIYNINNHFSNFFLHLNTTRFENYLNLDRKKFLERNCKYLRLFNIFFMNKYIRNIWDFFIRKF